MPSHILGNFKFNNENESLKFTADAFEFRRKIDVKRNNNWSKCIEEGGDEGKLEKKNCKK